METSDITAEFVGKGKLLTSGQKKARIFNSGKVRNVK